MCGWSANTAARKPCSASNRPSYSRCSGTVRSSKAPRLRTASKGWSLRPRRIRDLVAKRTEPANRSEQEIAGYRDVLNSIHTNFGGMQLTSNLVLQLHHDLFQFVPSGGGRWKSADNDITETRPDGTTILRFKPLAPHLVADAMAQLHDRHRAALDTGAVDPLLVVPTYVLDFLCIHPFADGSGRIARLLTLLLLYQAGYQVGRDAKVSVEQWRRHYNEVRPHSSLGYFDAGRV